MCSSPRPSIGCSRTDAQAAIPVTCARRPSRLISSTISSDRASSKVTPHSPCKVQAILREQIDPADADLNVAIETREVAALKLGFIRRYVHDDHRPRRFQTLRDRSEEDVFTQHTPAAGGTVNPFSKRHLGLPLTPLMPRQTRIHSVAVENGFPKS